MNFGENLSSFVQRKIGRSRKWRRRLGLSNRICRVRKRQISALGGNAEAIVKAFVMMYKEFLKDIDHSVLSGPLKQIQEVANFIFANGGDLKCTIPRNGCWVRCGLHFGVCPHTRAARGVFSKRQYIYLSEGVIFATRPTTF